MNTPQTKSIQCPGCGLTLPDQNLPPSDRYNASGECQRLNEELSAYHLQLGDAAFLHQHAVDSYGAQHADAPSRSITTAYALVGLYLAIEHGYTGRQVQQAHAAMGKHKIKWPTLNRPASPGVITVQDVLQAPPGEARKAMLFAWAESVWGAWVGERKWVGEVAGRVLKVVAP